MSMLSEVAGTIGTVAAGVGPSVVGVRDGRGHGSGVVIAPGRILTNAHNLGGDRATVVFADGRTVEARALGVDVDADVAVLEADTGDSPAVEWGAADPPIGAAILTLSNPGGKGLRVTVGFVSGTQRRFRGPRGRRIGGAIEHTAPLLPGSSGGPTVDEHGILLGINTHRLGEGFYLAIPADDALRERVDALGRGEAVARPRLGVALAPAHVARRLRRAVGLPDVEGLLVRGVEEGSAAARAGIAEGDLIISVGGAPVSDLDVLHAAIERGATLELTILRGSEERTVTVDLRAAA